ncbi:hypothetical protein BC939DRAFT_502981 [Gamsiella multidivaricata]|uniref:uncharacterized protein n=1 Tax=Gamsiella multidivaricata TaxID=101098 RepID=UPI002220C785|nr:uncharacterized protein BC939DRAFT_502981 [Gamsiella multidivaricata]KAI7823787.1 hypothetical protein BC939DRAFT_502981 [Gamsiella multidivaricata]
MEVLEGADLRQLESFLIAQDQDRALGNPYSIVTREEHVKWVHIDHYRENYHGSVMEQFLELVMTYYGRFNLETGSLELIAKSSTIARQLFDAMEKSCGIRKLTMLFFSETNVDELWVFATAVSKANIVELALMLDGRIKTMRILYPNFYQHTWSTSMKTSHQLQSLWIRTPFFQSDRSCKMVVTRIVKYCPSLMELTLEVDSDRIQAMNAMTLNLASLYPGEQALLLKGYLIEPTTYKHSAKTMEGQLKELFPSKLLNALKTMLFWFVDRKQSEHHDEKMAWTFANASAKTYLTTTITMGTEPSSDEQEQLPILFRQYGWSVSQFTVNHLFNDSLATLLDTATAEGGSSLKSLSLDPILEKMQNKTERDKLHDLLKRHRKKSTRLVVGRKSAEDWMQDMKQRHPTKLDVPALEDFRPVSVNKGSYIAL